MIDAAADALSAPGFEAEQWVGKLFKVEWIDDTAIIVPKIAHGFRYTLLHIEANALQRRLEAVAINGLIIDLHALDYVGSEVIGALVALARKAENAGGDAVFCGALPRLRSAMANIGLDRIWPQFGTREEALSAILQRRRAVDRMRQRLVD